MNPFYNSTDWFQIEIPIMFVKFWKGTIKFGVSMYFFLMVGLVADTIRKIQSVKWIKLHVPPFK